MGARDPLVWLVPPMTFQSLELSVVPLEALSPANIDDDMTASQKRNEHEQQLCQTRMQQAGSPAGQMRNSSI